MTVFLPGEKHSGVYGSNSSDPISCEIGLSYRYYLASQKINWLNRQNPMDVSASKRSSIGQEWNNVNWRLEHFGGQVGIWQAGGSMHNLWHRKPQALKDWEAYYKELCLDQNYGPNAY